MEMVIKMVALGIFGRRCYLGDTWNRLDFFIVMAGSELPVPVVRSSSRRGDTCSENSQSGTETYVNKMQNVEHTDQNIAESFKVVYLKH